MESVDYLETSVNTNLRCLTFQKSENLICNVAEAEIAQMSFLFTDVSLVSLFVCFYTRSFLSSSEFRMGAVF